MKPIFSIPFIMLSFITGIIILALGLIFMGLGGVGTNALRELACDSNEHTEGQYMATVDKFMCSKTCPCPPGNDDYFKNLWIGYGFSKLYAHNRVPVASELSPTQVADYRYNGDLAKITPLYFAVDNENSYSNFMDCYYGKLKQLL